MSGKKWAKGERRKRINEIDAVFRNAPVSTFYWEFGEDSEETEDNAELPIKRYHKVSSGPVDRVTIHKEKSYV